MVTGRVGVETIACICSVKPVLVTPGYIIMPCIVVLDFPINNALNPSPVGPQASRGTLCTSEVHIVTVTEVETSISAAPRVPLVS